MSLAHKPQLIRKLTKYIKSWSAVGSNYEVEYLIGRATVTRTPIRGFRRPGSVLLNYSPSNWSEILDCFDVNPSACENTKRLIAHTVMLSDEDLRNTSKWSLSKTSIEYVLKFFMILRWLTLSQASQEIKLFALEYHHNNIIQSRQFVGNEAIGMHK